MINILSVFLSLLSRSVLFVMGWKSPTNEQFKQIAKHDRTILVFSHTSYVDFYIMILYLLAFPQQLKYLRTIVKPQPFEYIGGLLRRLGAIPATKVDDKNGGSVNRIVEELKQVEKSRLLISPKGTIVKREWRSGYYYIAKELDGYLMAVGLDYERKAVFVSKEISHSEGELIVKEFLMKQLGEVVPLFPEEEVVSIRPHVESERGVMSFRRMLAVGLVVVLGVIKLY